MTEAGLVAGEKNGAFTIQETKLDQDEEFSMLPEGLTKSRMTKTQRFIYKVEQLLNAAGATLTSKMSGVDSILKSYKWVVLTEVGPYFLDIYHDPNTKVSSGVQVWSIMGRLTSHSYVDEPVKKVVRKKLNKITTPYSKRKISLK